MGEAQGIRDRDVLVVRGVQQNRNGRVEQVEKLDGTLRVHFLAGEEAQEVEPEHGHGHVDILVEGEVHQITHANVIVAAVLQQQRAQVAELRNGIIGRIHRLHTFLASNSHLKEKKRKQELLTIAQKVSDSARQCKTKQRRNKSKTDALHSYPDVRGSNHGHVVGAITHGQGPHLRHSFLHQHHDFSTVNNGGSLVKYEILR